MKNYFGLLARLLLGGVFLWAGIAKLMDPLSFADAVRNFRIVGDPIAPGVALFLPWLEIFAAISVLWGRTARAGATILLGCVCVFCAALILAWMRGLDISCGCFGGTGAVNYPVRLLQNAVLVALCMVVWLSSFANGRATRVSA